MTSGRTPIPVASVMAEHRKPLLSRRQSPIEVFIGILLLIASASAPASPAGIKLQLDDGHQFTYSGYYAADWQEIYLQAGLNVEILPGIDKTGKRVNAIDKVLSGEADIGVATSAELLHAYGNGRPVVALSVILQRSDVQLYTKSSTLLPSALSIGKNRLATPTGDKYQLPLKFLIKRSEEKGIAVDYIVSDDPLSDLEENRVQVIVGSSLTTPYLAEKRHLDLKPIDFSIVDINLPGQTIFTSESFLHEQHDVVDEFVTASLRGWEYALKNSDEISLALGRKELSTSNPGSTFGIGFYQVEKVRELSMFPVVPFGSISPNRWENEYQSLSRAFSYDKDFEEHFLHDPDKHLRSKLASIELITQWALSLAGILAILGFVTYKLRQAHRIEIERKLKQQASFDSLTSLPNRAMANEVLESWVRSHRHSESLFYVMFLDLDGFKIINDTQGHGHGDELLIRVAHRLQSLLTNNEWVARIGGDEFLILCQINERSYIEDLAQRVLNSLRQSITVEASELQIGASIGVARFPDDGNSAPLLLSHADVAMYRAKETGKNQVYFYTKELSRQSQEKLEIANRLHHALENEEFFLCYQPIVNLQSQQIDGAEALIRWQNPDLGLVPPDRFISVAEETGLIREIGKWVLKTALADMAAWNLQLNSDVYVSVNVSPRQFSNSDFNKTVISELNQNEISSNLLKIEITESLLIVDFPETAELLLELDSNGVEIFMDDFGTGYSSLSYLKNFPVKTLKIDRSFTNEVTYDHRNASLVTAMVAMAKGLKMKVVAEGVENNDQLQFLKQIDCEFAQGYLYSKPVKREEFVKLLYCARNFKPELCAA